MDVRKEMQRNIDKKFNVLRNRLDRIEYEKREKYYPVPERIAYYQDRVNDMTISAAQRKYAKKRLLELQKQKSRY